MFDVLRDGRLDHARQALEADAISLKELSYRVGYNHVSSFVHAFRARHQSLTRLEGQVGEMRIALRHVGGVGDDERETLRHAFKPAALFELHVQRMLAAIRPRHLQCVVTCVYADHACTRQLALDRQSQRAAAGAKIQHRGRLPRQRQLDEQLGFWPRDQNGGRHGERGQGHRLQGL